MLDGLKGDSFFTLTVPEQIGLGLLSATMLIILAVLAYLIVGRFGRRVGIGIVVALYWGFLWAAPQVYYMYYLAIFDSLPLQWVIGPAPDLGPILLVGAETLSQIAQGLGFWIVLLAGWVGGWRTKTA